jgi:YD repeat-containing protein
LVSVSDNFPSIAPTYNPFRHYLFTIEEASQRKHAFELDSYFRVISYQPPGATTPQYTYKLCSNLVGDALRNCFGMTQWHHHQPFDMPPLFFDQVESVTRNDQTWQYNAFYTTASLPYNSTWRRIASDPRGGAREAKGNSMPGTETLYGGSTVSMTMRDGTILGFAYSVANQPTSVLTPRGIKTEYAYDARGNLEKITRTPIANSGQSVLVQSASYPTDCPSWVSCNKPTTVTDANSNTSRFEYDHTHGGVKTVTSPAVNGISPEVRYRYLPRNAWYRDASGTMARDSRAIWVLTTESFCRTGAAVNARCTVAGDEVVTTYEYGPESGPNNLLVRGKSVTADGRTLRTCYGHDKQGNKIWETSPNANPSSCTDY